MHTGMPFASPEEAVEHFGIKGMRWGVRKEREPGEFDNWGQPFNQEADGMGHGSKQFELKKPQDLRVDRVDGIVDVRSKNGYASESARKVHDDLISSLMAMREAHPNVADLKIVVAPSSHMRYGPGGSTQAAVMHTKPGEIHVAYNDKLKDFSPRKAKSWANWVPGTQYEGYVANHEMGHVLAAGGKLTPPGWDLIHSKTFSESLRRAEEWTTTNEANHKAAMVKHGLSFDELSKISPYAATSASEAYAEAVGSYYTPQTNKQLTPEVRTKIKAMIDDAGGS